MSVLRIAATIALQAISGDWLDSADVRTQLWQSQNLIRVFALVSVHAGGRKGEAGQPARVAGRGAEDDDRQRIEAWPILSAGAETQHPRAHISLALDPFPWWVQVTSHHWATEPWAEPLFVLEQLATKVMCCTFGPWIWVMVQVVRSMQLDSPLPILIALLSELPPYFYPQQESGRHHRGELLSYQL